MNGYGYTPRIGDLVHDEATCKLGLITDRIGPYWQLRPPGGGREWDARGPLRPATPAERHTALGRGGRRGSGP